MSATRLKEREGKVALPRSISVTRRLASIAAAASVARRCGLGAGLSCLGRRECDFARIGVHVQCRHHHEP